MLTKAAQSVWVALHTEKVLDKQGGVESIGSLLKVTIVLIIDQNGS